MSKRDHAARVRGKAKAKARREVRSIKYRSTDLSAFGIGADK